jgi:hypothetical protein
MTDAQCKRVNGWLELKREFTSRMCVGAGDLR